MAFTSSSLAIIFIPGNVKKFQSLQGKTAEYSIRKSSCSENHMKNAQTNLFILNNFGLYLLVF